MQGPHKNNQIENVRLSFSLGDPFEVMIYMLTGIHSYKLASVYTLLVKMVVIFGHFLHIEMKMMVYFSDM